MEWWLNLLVSYGGIIGIIPPKLPWTPLSLYRIKWCSIGVIYCLTIMALTATIVTDFLYNNGTNYFGNFTLVEAPPTSVEVINTTVWINYLSNIFFLRLNSLNYAHHFAQLLRNLSMLHVRLDVLSARCHCRHKKDVEEASWFYKVMGALACASLVTNQFMQSKKFYRLFNKDEFKSWLLEPKSILTACVELFPDLIHCVTVCFAVLEFLLLGISLLNLYTSFGSILRQLWTTREKSELVAYPRAIAETFELLQETMMLYNTVCGVDMFVLITTYTISITWVVYGFYLDGLSFGITSVLVVGLIFVVLTSLGEYFEKKMTEIRESIRASVILRHNKDNMYRDERKLLEITQWFLQWQWTPTANGFYRINHSLIHVVISASLAHTIFVFQLRATEI